MLVAELQPSSPIQRLVDTLNGELIAGPSSPALAELIEMGPTVLPCVIKDLMRQAESISSEEAESKLPSWHASVVGHIAMTCGVLVFNDSETFTSATRACVAWWYSTPLNPNRES